jgi:hypothetical protein
MSRGSYRAIHTVLIDGPDYQALTPAARLVLLTLKLNLGPTGIDVLYPAVLEAQTGLGEDDVFHALALLEEREWIRHERNVFWIIEGLRYEPSRALSNANHRKEIAEHLEALPRLAIVDAFREHYHLTPDAMPNGMPDTIPEGMGNGITNGIPKGESHAIPKHGVTEERRNGRRKNGETENSVVRAASAAARRVRSPGVTAVVDLWTARIGAVTHASVARLLGPAIDRHGEAAVLRAIDAYAAEQVTRGKALKLSWFAEQVAAWVERTAPIVDPATGLLNERGLAIVGGDR